MNRELAVEKNYLSLFNLFFSGMLWLTGLAGMLEQLRFPFRNYLKKTYIYDQPPQHDFLKDSKFFTESEKFFACSYISFYPSKSFKLFKRLLRILSHCNEAIIIISFGKGKLQISLFTKGGY